MVDWREIIESLPLGSGVRLIRVDANGLCALEKPEGTLSHPNSPDDRDRSLFQAEYDPDDESFVIDEDGKMRRVFLINRLDSATSGLILVALDRVVAEAVREAFRRREVDKIYQAFVFGHARSPRQEWIDRMNVKGGGGSIRAGDSGPYKAETDMRRLRLLPGPPAMSLLELVPKTGRTHQLRFQCAKHRLPIVGDKTYGEFKRNREFARRTGSRRLFLHSSEIRFEYEHSGRSNHFDAKSPLPEEFCSFR
jgi:23S rRNA-/tRNA-specific pseudouridylate synthase